MNKHWTQTDDGRKKVAAAMRKAWANRKLEALKAKTFTPQGKAKRVARALAALDGNSVQNKLRSANTIEQLNEVKSFLDLRDELLARMP